MAGLRSDPVIRPTKADTGLLLDELEVSCGLTTEGSLGSWPNDKSTVLNGLTVSDRCEIVSDTDRRVCRLGDDASELRCLIGIAGLSGGELILREVTLEARLPCVVLARRGCSRAIRTRLNGEKRSGFLGNNVARRCSGSGLSDSAV